MNCRNIPWSMLFIALVITPRISAQPQTFKSGSTGADGDLTYAANLGLVYFPPATLTPRTIPVYNFKTITIPAGTTVRLSGWIINAPVYWLAQGDVNISGTLDLSGQPGTPSEVASNRYPSEPGSGGWPGGIAGINSGTTGQPAQPGAGPGGGAAASASSNTGTGGTFTGSQYLIPLTGGSGGGGGCGPTASGCGGGGAGGGAILIASSTTITITNPGAINAKGGSYGGGSGIGGCGSGGAIRLMANIFMDNTINYGYYSLNVFGGCSGGLQGAGSGLVRLEAFSITTGVISNYLTSTPNAIALPASPPSTVQVTSINGVTINANPFTFPDLQLTTGTSVPVVIQGVYVPPNTPGNLYVLFESTPDKVVPFTLTGTLASTTATVNIAFPPGGARGYAKVTWSGTPDNANFRVPKQ